MTPVRYPVESGPFRADQIRQGDPYELSNGHAILCLPSSPRGGVSNLLGGTVLESDPAVQTAGVDVGFSSKPGQLRAPDVSVGNFPVEPGWAQGVPPLAVEYADTGQDEASLQTKITELLTAGTRFIWVVRLVGPRRVEVYEPDKPMRLLHLDDTLHAPGVLANPVPVRALYEREAAHEATLRNLLQRKGYQSLDDVHKKGRKQGKKQGQAQALLTLLEARGLPVGDSERKRIQACTSEAQLQAWIRRSLSITAVDELFEP